MSRVITFSRIFPSYHPRAGEPTYFVEKIWRSFNQMDVDGYYLESIQAYSDVYNDLIDNGSVDHIVPFSNLIPKHHTIRAGHRYKVGDWFSPRVWSGKPYNSKQITIAPDIQVKKTWDFSFLSTGMYQMGKRQFDGEVESHHELLELIAQHDGLSKSDFLEWFRYPRAFYGQIICWNENINY